MCGFEGFKNSLLNKPTCIRVGKDNIMHLTIQYIRLQICNDSIIATQTNYKENKSDFFTLTYIKPGKNPSTTFQKSLGKTNIKQ